VRFSLAETMCDPSHYAPLARAAEAAGFHAYTLPDSIAYPQESDSRYPYTPDGRREFLEDKPFLCPFSLIPCLAAQTTTLEFHTFVVKMPIRHPVLLAKQAASVAVLSGGRFHLGVGSSPWPEDYRITGVPWARRGRRMDEMIGVTDVVVGFRNAYVMGPDTMALEHKIAAIARYGQKIIARL